MAFERTAMVTTSSFLYAGLRAIGCPERLLGRNVPMQRKVVRYKACFGQLPLIHAKIWQLLAPIDEKRNLERFYMLLFYYKTYPTESVLSVRFGIEEDTVRWWLAYYRDLLASLKEDLIQMPENFPDSVHFPLVVDGTQCCVFRVRHELYPVDPAYFGHKRKTDSFNYQVGISSFEPKLYCVDGPYPAGAFPDARVFVDSGLQESMVSQNKRAIADGGYDGTEGAVTPNRKYHSKTTNQYFRRQRARIERTMAYFKN